MSRCLASAVAAGLSLATALCGSAAWADQQSGVKVISPVYGQLFMHTLPAGFKPVFEDTQPTGYIRESVLAGETVKQWTQMVSVTGVKGLAAKPNASPQVLAAGIAGGFKRVCPASYSGISLGPTSIDGFDAYVAVASCGTVTTPGGVSSETALLIVIKGAEDYYTLQWAERGEPSKTPLKFESDRWQERFNQLMPIKLCPIVPGEAAPYPSCSAQ